VYKAEYFLFTIEGREDIKDKEPKRLVSMKVADVPLECIYKLTDRDGGKQFTKYYRFKNKRLLDHEGEEKDTRRLLSTFTCAGGPGLLT